MDGCLCFERLKVEVWYYIVYYYYILYIYYYYTIIYYTIIISYTILFLSLIYLPSSSSDLFPLLFCSHPLFFLNLLFSSSLSILFLSDLLSSLITPSFPSPTFILYVSAFGSTYLYTLLFFPFQSSVPISSSNPSFLIPSRSRNTCRYLHNLIYIPDSSSKN